ncbi:SDR family NAD(P)-dependent oxidoreductase [Microbacterium sp. MAHUQ-60]|uniref:SDR family NAD(P)-dependent oxidoreductase n=1 Tax=unclassified Microbacterium TaxID=2609290 RepID=UPI003608B20F
MHNLFDLTGRTALVTGGSRGLGRAMVHALASAGANVVIVSRNEQACIEYASEIEQTTSRRAIGIGAHLGRWESIGALVDRVDSEVGKIDILINNAGMSPLYDSPTSITEELFDKVVAVNLKGPFRLSALMAERMRDNGGGSIINISSAGSVHPRPHILPYAAAKAGLNAITQGMAFAYGPTVRVNAVIAGTFLSDVSKSWDPEVFRRRAEGFALQRAGEPDEIVGTILYLASDASSYTTGSLVTVDGGQP